MLHLSQTTVPIAAISFNNLLDIDDVSPYSEEDVKVIAQLGKVLIAHNMHQRFGISLIHKHYDLKENEIVLETTSEQNAKEFSMSVASFDNQSDVLPSMWRFVAGNTKIEATQWMKCSDKMREQYSLMDEDLLVLLALRTSMMELGCMDRFGVSLLHRVLPLANSEFLMEGTDVDNRSQIMELLPMAELDEGQSIETLWSMSGDNTMHMSMGCRFYCHYDSGHRQRHQQTHRPT